MLPDDGPYRATYDLAEAGVTLILFLDGAEVMAEVIGPAGHGDAVAPMPEALAIAHDRGKVGDGIAVVDDERLWQPAWGTLKF